MCQRGEAGESSHKRRYEAVLNNLEGKRISSDIRACVIEQNVGFDVGLCQRD